MNWTPLPRAISGTLHAADPTRTEVVLLFYRTDSSNQLEYMSMYGNVFKARNFSYITVPGMDYDHTGKVGRDA